MIIEGVKEEQGGEWSVFPNPGSAELWLEHTGGDHPQALVTIRDLLGRSVRQGSIATSPARIETASLPHGLYILEIQDGRATNTFKWVKE